MKVARVFEGQILTGAIPVEPGSILDPNMVPVIEDVLPVFSSSTHRVEAGPLVLDGGGTFVRQTWAVVALSAGELADSAEREQIKTMLTGIDAALVKLNGNTATIGEVRGYLAHVLRFIKRLIKTQGLP